MNNLQQLGIATGLAVSATAILYIVSLLPVGSRSVTTLTNVHGIPYEQVDPVRDRAPEVPARLVEPRSLSGVDQEIMVTQSLAHVDVQLQEPVFGKQLKLSFSFRPEKSQTLAVSVRENDFWLSYQPIIFYDTRVEGSHAPFERTVTIPLTDKLQDADRSIDVMFIANGQTDSSLQDEVQDSTLWYIRDIGAEVTYGWPTATAMKDYVKSLLTRERPL